MEEERARTFLDGLIEKESCLIERLFIQSKMPDKSSTKVILKINALRFFQNPIISNADREGWSGSVWYSKDFLGGWIYELRQKGFSDCEIYDFMIDAKSEFLIREKYKNSYHRVYDAMIKGLMDRVPSA